jgi:hypothetical protein
VFTWPQLSSSVADLIEVTKLEKLPGCAKAVEKFRDIKRLADVGKGTLSAAEFETIADKYALARNELEVAFKALPSELRKAGQLEMPNLRYTYLSLEAKMTELQSIERMALGVSTGAAGAGMVAFFAGGAKTEEGVGGAAGAAAKLSEAGSMLRVFKVAEFDELFLRRAASLTEEQAAKEGLHLFTWPQLSISVANLVEVTNLEQLPGCAKAADKFRDIKFMADARKGSLTAAEFEIIADKYALARKELEAAFVALLSELRRAGQLEMQELRFTYLSVEAKLTELQGIERMARENGIELIDLPGIGLTPAEKWQLSR